MLYVYVVEVRACRLHLAPDAVRGTVAYFGTYIQTIAGQTVYVLPGHLPDLSFVFLTVELHLSRNEFVVLGTAVLEREVLQLTLDLVHTKTVCKRSIEVVCLSSDLHLLVRTHTAERTHIMQTVGKLDEQRTDIVMDRCEHLMEVVYLLGVVVLLLLLLGYCSDQKGDIVTESFPYILYSVVCVLHYIVQESRYDGVCIEVKLFCNDL